MGLPWELVGREHQEACLEQALEMRQSILVLGPSGSGKSALIRQQLQDFLFGAGKYDQYTQESYSAIRTALREYLSLLEPCDLQRLGGLFTPEEVTVLDVLGIGKLLHAQLQEDTVVMSDATTLRLHQLVRKLLSSTPCTLFLDDLQWADDASRKLLEVLLEDHALDFCLVGAIRTGEKTTFAPPPGVEMEQLTLPGLSVVDLQHLLRFVDNPQPLAMTVWRVTGGNPYFIRQFLENMILEGTLCQESPQWKYKPQALACSIQLGDVVDLLVSKIRLVKPVTQALLMLASALGHTIREDVLDALLTSTDLLSRFPSSFTEKRLLQVVLDDGLQDAQEHGLIQRTAEHGFRFTHDRVQQAAYSMIPKGSSGGKILGLMGQILAEMSESLQHKDTWLLHTAATLLSHHRSHINKDPKDIAILCLKSAQASVGNMAYVAAAAFTDVGIDMLQPDPWNKNYELCLELFSLSAETHRCALHFVKTKQRVVAIQKHARRLEDKFRGFNVLLNTLMREKKYSEAVVQSHLGMQMLGYKMKCSHGLFSIIRLLRSTNKALKQCSYDEIMQRPLSNDPKPTEAINLLYYYCFGSWFVGKSLDVAAGALLGVMINVKNDLGPLTGGGFSMYAVAMSSIGKAKIAYDYAKLSISNDYPVPQRRHCFCIVIFGAFANHAVHPLSNFFDLVEEAHRDGLSNGEMTDVCTLLFLRYIIGFYAGMNLFQLQRIMMKDLAFCMDYKEKAHVTLFAIGLQLKEALQGKTNDPLTLCGSRFSEKEDFLIKAKSVDADEKKPAFDALVAKILLLFVHEAHERALPLIKKFLKEQEDGKSHVRTLLVHVVCALHYYALARQTRRSRYIGMAKPHVKPWKLLDREYSSINSQALLALLKAEKYAARRHPGAVSRYQHAIPLLQEGKFYLWEALAHERLASLLQSKAAARASFETAISKYEAYGAMVKVSMMKKRLVDL